MGADAARWLYLSVVIVYGFIVYYMLTRSIRMGSPLRAVAWCWLASPLPLVFVARGVEGRDIGQLLNPEVQSWAFLFGDTVFLPFMAAMLALAWRKLPRPVDNLYVRLQSDAADPPQYQLVGWYAGVAWRMVCAVLGAAAGITFHTLDGVNYTELALNSPTKLLHDYTSYGVLSGALVYGLAALSAPGARKWALVSLLGFTLWLGGGVADNTLHKLDGRNLHIQYDWEHYRTIPY